MLVTGRQASGIDTIMNEYFIECQDILIEPLEMLFNVLLESAIYPSQWTKDVVINIITQDFISQKFPRKKYKKI